MTIQQDTNPEHIQITQKKENLMKNIHKIICNLVGYLIDACGITLLIIFFNWSSSYTKESIYAIALTTYTILLLCSGFAWLFSNSPHKDKTENEFPIMSDDTRKKISAHEAGHAIMCHKLNIPVDYINVSPEHSYVTTTISCQNADDIRNIILILYAGAAAEEICCKDESRLPGNNETAMSDFKRANELLKEYIVLTDDTVSKTYLDIELMDKMILYSKQFYEECRTILLDKENMLNQLSITLYEKGNMSKEQVRNFFAQ